MDIIPVIVFWILAAIGIARGAGTLFCLTMCSLPFGAFAVLPPEFIGGLTLTPTPVFALFFSFNVLLSQSGLQFIKLNLFRLNSFGFLTAFVIISAVVTIFAPRMYEETIDIISVRGLVTRPMPLTPTTQNFSQFAYFTMSVAFTIAATCWLSISSKLESALFAICAGGFATLLTGVLDISSQFANLSSILSPLRTATYSLLVDNEVLGVKRIVGLMPEASAFGGLCVAQAATLHFFNRLLPAGRMKSVFAPALVAGLLALAALSTSSTAIVSLAVFGLAALCNWSLLFVRGAAGKGTVETNKAVNGEAAYAAIAIVTITLMVLLAPQIFDPALKMLDRMVFQKTSSDSYTVRSMWTRVSWDAMVATGGFGVGIGSTRASNGIVAIISSTGIIGFISFSCFVFQRFFMRRAQFPAIYADYQECGRFPYLIILFASALSGTTVDFGVLAGALFALMSLISIYREKTQQPGSSASKAILRRRNA